MILIKYALSEVHALSSWSIDFLTHSINEHFWTDYEFPIEKMPTKTRNMLIEISEQTRKITIPFRMRGSDADFVVVDSKMDSCSI